MKNLILTLVFGLVSLVTFSQDVSVNDSTLVDGDTLRLTINNADSVILKNLYGNTLSVWEYPNEQFVIGEATNEYTWNPDTINIKGTSVTKYVKVSNLFYKIYLIVTFDATASLSENSIDVTDLKVYPNPATTDVKISFESNVSDAPVVIVNTSGQVVYSNTDNKSFGTNTLDVNVSDWQKGMYFAKSGKQTFKFVVM